MTGNLDKIAKHGDNTVRIVKAMEELLKDHSANRTCVDINDLCKVNLDILRKNYAKEIEKNQVDLSFSGLSVPLTIEVNIDQMGKALSQILDNSIYAVLKRPESRDISLLSRWYCVFKRISCKWLSVIMASV